MQKLCMQQKKTTQRTTKTLEMSVELTEFSPAGLCVRKIGKCKKKKKIKLKLSKTENFFLSLTDFLLA